MKVLVRVRAGRRFFLTFSVLNVPLLVEALCGREEFSAASAAEKGDGCMKDTDHCSRHRGVHHSDGASVRNKKKLSMAGRSIWTRHGPVLGWSDPTFAHGSVPKVIRGSLQPSQKFPPVPACIAGFQTKPVKKVRITLCTFKLATSSPDARRRELVLKDLRKPNPRNLPRKTGQIGRERPHFFAVNPPKSFWGSLPPARSLRSKPHGERE
jgi:hypothetical protein